MLMAVTIVVAVMAGEVYQLPRELVLLGRRAYQSGDLGVRPSAWMGRGADDVGEVVEELEALRSMTELEVLTEGGSWNSLASRSLDSSSVGA